MVSMTFRYCRLFSVPLKPITYPALGYLFSVAFVWRSLPPGVCLSGFMSSFEFQPSITSSKSSPLSTYLPLHSLLPSLSLSSSLSSVSLVRFQFHLSQCEMFHFWREQGLSLFFFCLTTSMRKVTLIVLFTAMDPEQKTVTVIQKISLMKKLD